MSGIGIRCSHKRAKRNSGARSNDQGFTHISLPFVSTFDVLFVGGNNHVSARGLFVVGRLLDAFGKDASGVSALQHFRSYRRPFFGITECLSAPSVPAATAERAWTTW